MSCSDIFNEGHETDSKANCIDAGCSETDPSLAALRNLSFLLIGVGVVGCLCGTAFGILCCYRLKCCCFRPSQTVAGVKQLLVSTETPKAIDVAVVMDTTTKLSHVFGRRERESAPENYGTVELTSSSKNDVTEEVVRSMYSHISDGYKRSERIIACNKKIVYVPESDLGDLLQVYRTWQVSELRGTLKSEDGSRRALRFFYNDGSSLSA